VGPRVDAQGIKRARIKVSEAKVSEAKAGVCAAVTNLNLTPALPILLFQL